MTPIRDPSTARAGTAICSDLLTSACVRVTMDMLPVLRQRPGPGIGESLPATFLRHADEQTVAALAAVLHAIHGSGMSVADCRDWGIVAAPCFLGRATLAVALQRLAAEGAWGISPHFIPHRSQHAVSGSISQVLKIFGPNFGTGGGPGGVVEALVAGSVLLEGNRLPGVWVVATEWEPEPIPDANGCFDPAAVCHALALALVGTRPGWQGVRLRVLPRAKGARTASGPGQIVQKVSQLQALLTTLTQEDTLPDTVAWPLDGVGWIELGRGGAGASRQGDKETGRQGDRTAGVQVASSSPCLPVSLSPCLRSQSGAGTENKR